MNDTGCSPRELAEILLLDQHQRWRRGERVFVENYLELHPRLASHDEEVLDLLYNEIFLRTQRGELPAVAEYRQRFPHLAAALQMQFDVHHALGPAGPLPGSLTEERAPVRTLTPVALPAIPGYEILGELGRGGMGVVYKARQTALGRLVALKLIRGGRRPSAQQLARFRIEAEAIAQLSHPNVVRLYEVGEHEGWPYLSLELIEGGSLAAHCARRPQPPRQAAALVETLAHAVHFAHLHGIVHRDLKPANILLASGEQRAESGEPNGLRLSARHSLLSTPKITDFGLAKRLDRDTHLTRLGDVVGTPQYMAAEQARGRSEDIGPGTDVFGLGAILYELLTGQPPVQASSVAVALQEVKETAPRPPRQLCRQVPRDLDAICLKCLRKRPQDRYASAEGLAEDLRRFLRGEPVQARSVGPAARAWKWARRRPFAAVQVAAVFLALLALELAGRRSGGRLQTERDQAVHEVRVLADQRDALRQAKEEIETQRDTAHQAMREVEVQRDAAQRAREEAERQRNAMRRRLQEAQRSLYALQLAQAAALWSIEPNRGLEILDDPERCPPPLRDFTWGLLRRGCSRSHVDLAGPKGATHAVAYSPANRLLAAAGADATVWLWDEARKPRALAGHTDRVLSVTFSLDGRWLASAGADHTVRIWEVDSGKQRWVLNDIKSRVQSVAFNAAGSVLALGCYDGNVRMWGVGNGAGTVTLTTGPASKKGKGRRHAVHKGPVHCVAFSPDGHTFASASEDHTIRLWDTSTGAPHGTLVGHQEPVYVLGFAPDGRTLASGGDDGEVRLWDTARTALRVKLHAHMGAVRALAFSADGTTLATGSANRAPARRPTLPEVKLWDANTGQPYLSFPHPSGAVHALAFVGDGRQLALAGEAPTVELWDAWRALERDTVRYQEGAVHVVAFTPDGKTLALAGKDRSIRLCDPLTGEARRTLSHNAEVRGLAFTPDGRFLVSAGEDGTLKVWDGGRLHRTLAGHEGAVTAAAVSPNGDLLASAGADGSIRLWRRDTGKEEHILIGHQDGVTAVAFTADGREVLSAGRDGRVRCRDSISGQARTVLHVPGETVLSLALSPDGRTVACGGSDGLVRLCDLRDGKERRILRRHRGVVLALAFSPDGRTLASGAAPDDQGRVQAPGEVKLWDPVTGQVRVTLRGHGDGVTCAAFSPDGRLLITGSGDGSVKFWEALPPNAFR